MADQDSAASDPVVDDLLVLWQHPVDRSIVPIGRLTHHADNFAFSYTRAAAGVEGFRPLPGLRDLHTAYQGTRLPPVFEQRVMHPERPDYPSYLESIGLEPSQASPWEQIVHSRGFRAGDTLQFMQTPAVQHGRARARFFANGVRHIPTQGRILGGRVVRVTPQQHEEALGQLRQGMQVELEPENDNDKDPNATLITSAGVPLGYVPWCLSESVRELCATGHLRLTVARLAPPWASTHVRLVLDLDVPAPPGFKFDRAGQWEPLSPAQ